MKTDNIHEAKTQLSRSVEEATSGEPFIIARAGHPLVKVIALESSAAPRRIGFMSGEIDVPDDFDSMGADEIERFLLGCRLRLLLDTCLLLWAAGRSKRLSATARRLSADPDNELHSSVASLWEIAIKRSLGREDLRVDARVLRRGLIDNGYAELAISGEHALATESLPTLHRDPFDRLLLAQAMTEGMKLSTSDPVVAGYPTPVRKV